MTQGFPAAGSLFKVWGSSASNVIVVGDHGAIARWNGSGFSSEASNVTDRIVTVAGRGRDELYAVGGLQGGFVLRSDGGC